MQFFLADPLSEPSIVEQIFVVHGDTLTWEGFAKIGYFPDDDGIFHVSVNGEKLDTKKPRFVVSKGRLCMFDLRNSFLPDGTGDIEDVGGGNLFEVSCWKTKSKK